MLEKLIKNIGKKITTVALAGTLLFSSGWDTYRTMSPNLIQPVTPIERPIERPIDYSKLTWQEAIEYVQTPEQAQDYLNNHFEFFDSGGFYIPGLINTSESGKTFRYLHKTGKGVCFDYATSASALLSDNNFPPLILIMEESFRKNHAVFLYRDKNGFSAIGNTPLSNHYQSVPDLVRGFQEEYGRNFQKYQIVNLDDSFRRDEWISGNVDLYKKQPYKFIPITK